MNKEKQRIAIAEACGLPKPYSMCFGKVPNTLCHSVMVTNGVKHGMPIPDYLQDLNAMHEAENTLSVRDKQGYISILRNICTVAGCWPETATAAQRARAFLETLGLWEDHK
jgi:hypothetical protein